MLPETSIIEAPEATTAPVATSWHYWVAFLHSRGFGAAAVALSGPITAAEDVARIVVQLAAQGVCEPAVSGWTLLRVDGQAHACPTCGRSGGAR
jgi:hypothetical protein